jgi:hypothetical protein
MPSFSGHRRTSVRALLLLNAGSPVLQFRLKQDNSSSGDGKHTATGIMKSGAPKREEVYDNHYLNEFRTVLIW